MGNPIKYQFDVSFRKSLISAEVLLKIRRHLYQYVEKPIFEYNCSPQTI